MTGTCHMMRVTGRDREENVNENEREKLLISHLYAFEPGLDFSPWVSKLKKRSRKREEDWEKNALRIPAGRERVSDRYSDVLKIACAQESTCRRLGVVLSFYCPH